MKLRDFSKLLLQIKEMDHRQRSILLDAFTHLSDDHQVLESIESRLDADAKCPFCSHANYYRYRCQWPTALQVHVLQKDF